MLRHPFLRLFGPLFGSQRGRSKQQSYRLTSRSNQRSIGLGSGKNGVEEDITDLERESEEHIIGVSSGTAGVADGRGSLDGGGILVKNEFTVTRSESLEDKKGHRDYLRVTEKNGNDSINEDKESGRSTFLHV